MLDRLLARLGQPPSPAPDTVGAPFPRRQLAVAALLIELAQIDRAITPEEWTMIERIVRERFHLDAATTARLVAAARVELDAALEDWVFAAAVREAFDERERVGIVELLWEVVYADGLPARLEASLMRRLCDELGIGEEDRAAARAHAFARSGRGHDEGPASTE
ncbi:MAG: TerB family tellurite resistance protein [Rudaea sp.]